MRSMTGYGKGSVTDDGRTLVIELKSVNNRYIEINSRIPKSMVACDDVVRRNVMSKINRGSIDVFFNYENHNEYNRAVTLDMTLAKEYVAVSKKLRDEFLLEDDFNTSSLMHTPEVLKIDSIKDDSDILITLTEKAVIIAINELNKMREIEGAAMKVDIIKLTNNIKSALTEVSERAPQVTVDYRNKITQRIQEILQGVMIDETRLLNEVAFFADKIDINEEIFRLTSHLSQFFSLLEGNEPQGRKLDFLSQEMNREINTIGSKSNDIKLTNLVIFMKNELEKIKEQIRNIE